MRRILVEVEWRGDRGKFTNIYSESEHRRQAVELGEDIALIVGEADIYTPHVKVVDTPDGLRRTVIIIVSTYVKTLEHEKSIVELVTTKRAEWELLEIRFNIVDEA